MKKVIRGRVYDTETAQEIGSTCGGGENRTDFHYWEETLYKKKTGEYFLHCFGVHKVDYRASYRFKFIVPVTSSDFLYKYDALFVYGR